MGKSHRIIFYRRKSVESLENLISFPSYINSSIMVDLVKKNYISMVIGPSQNGKDTLIYNFDTKNLENSFNGKR